MCKCSFNGSHFVPEDSLAKHERVCQLVTMGMDTEEAMVQLFYNNYYDYGVCTFYTLFC